MADSNPEEDSDIHILLVDDDTGILEVSKLILSEVTGFNVDCACNVQEAVQKMAASHFDAVVCDYEMPQKDGLEFLKELRDQGNRIPFVLFTGKGREEVAVKALNLGADGYINKQGNPETVYGELAHYLRNSICRRQAEEKIINQNITIESTLASANTAIFMVDKNYRYILFNEFHANWMKSFYNAKIELGKSLLDYQSNPVDREIAKRNIDRALAGEIVEDIQQTGEPNLLRSWVSVRHYPVKNQAGQIVGVSVFAVDLTKEKQAEFALKENAKALLESREKLQAIYQAIPVPTYTWQAVGDDFVLIDFNDAAKAVTKGKIAEQIGSKASVMYDDNPKIIEDMMRCLRDKNALEREMLYQFKTTGNFSYLNVKYAFAPPDLVLVHTEDITKRKQAEDTLKQLNDVLERVGEAVDAGLAVIGKDYRVVWANKRLKDLGVASNKKCFQTFSNLEYVCPDCGVKKIFEENLPLDVHEFKAVNAKGEVAWVELRVTPLKDKNGETMAALELAVPITERKKAEQELLESEEKFRTLAEKSPNMIFINHRGKVVYANQKCEEIIGYRREEFYADNFNFLSLIAPEHVKRIMDSFALHLKGKEVPPFEYVLVTRDGRRIDCIITTKLIDYGNDQALLGIVTDITERKKMEQQLMLSERKYREFAESLPEIVFEIDAEGNIVFVNQRATQITGYSISDFGKNFSFLQLVVPNETQAAFDNIGKLQFGEMELSGEFHIARKDGSVFPAIILANPIMVDEKFAGFRGIIVDISEHKKTENELKQAAKELQVLNEKLRVVGSLTRHDVANKLMTAKANLYLLKKHVDDQNKIARYLNAIDAALNSSEKLCEFSRLYEKIGAEKPADIKIEECFNQAVSLLHNLNQIKISNKTQGLEVVADSLLEQLFYNLLDNSLKHGKKVTQIKIHYKKAKDGQVNIFYEDNGVGIPTENKDRIFELGFSTAGGTGVGLPLIKKMIEVYGWTITEEGRAGKGAKFVISIPPSSVTKVA